ncbi:MAG: hypothetical protein K0U98_02280 [Deltaproteobacteria bacterium]|nr:hypothetical protein [Deltaproteobacteria bacterium]
MKLLGTAFDYSIRFGIENRRWARHHEVVASKGVEVSESQDFERGVCLRRLYNQAAACASCERELHTYSDELLDAYLVMAELDLLWRESPGHRPRREFSEILREDLRSYLRIVPWRAFKPHDRALLNPQFRVRSSWPDILKADPDLVVDSSIIEVKVGTVKNRARYSPTNLEILQLIAYAVCANLMGFAADSALVRVEKIGVFYAGAGAIVEVALADCLPQEFERRVLEVILLLAEGDPGIRIDSREATKLNAILGKF